MRARSCSPGGNQLPEQFRAEPRSHGRRTAQHRRPRDAAPRPAPNSEGFLFLKSERAGPGPSAHPEHCVRGAADGQVRAGGRGLRLVRSWGVEKSKQIKSRNKRGKNPTLPLTAHSSAPLPSRRCPPPRPPPPSPLEARPRSPHGAARRALPLPQRRAGERGGGGGDRSCSRPRGGARPRGDASLRGGGGRAAQGRGRAGRRASLLPLSASCGPAGSRGRPRERAWKSRAGYGSGLGVLVLPLAVC